MLLPLLVFSDHSWGKSHKLLVLGDSLSAAYGLTQAQGWVSLLQNAWQDSGVEVINGAISGDTTDGGRARLPKLLELHQPTHLLIELGGNDGLQGHPLNKVRDNLEAMILLAQERDIQVFLQEMQIPTNYGRRYTQRFTQTYQSLADKHQLPLIPFLLTTVALNDALMQNDGIHPNADAQPQIAEFMQQQLEPLILKDIH